MYRKKEQPLKISDYATHTTISVRIGVPSIPAEGVYGWDTNEKLKKVIQGALDRGMRLSFRVVVDSRDRKNEATPAYVFDAGAKYYTDNGKRSPYPDDPIFQEKYAKFIEAFAQKYNDPDLVEFIDGYGLGKWGEAHTMKYIDPKNREAVFNWITDLYVKHFTKVPLVINYHRWMGAGKDWAGEENFDPDSKRLLDSACEKGFSLRHDAFGMREYYGQWERNYVKPWIMKRPVLLEGGWIVSKHPYHNDPSGYKTAKDVRIGEFEDGQEAHVNMMDFRVGDETMSWFRDAYPLVERFISEGGYRLYPDSIVVPKEMKSGSRIKIVHRWNNLGWGYCPTNIPQWNQKYKVAFALLNQDNQVVYSYLDNNTDLSVWIKGYPTSYEFTPKLHGVKKGTYTWAVALVDTTKGNGSNVKGLDISAKGTFTNSGWLKTVRSNCKINKTPHRLYKQEAEFKIEFSLLFIKSNPSISFAATPSASGPPPLSAVHLLPSKQLPAHYKPRCPAVKSGSPDSYPAYPHNLPAEYRIQYLDRSGFPTRQQSWFLPLEHLSAYRYPTSCTQKEYRGHCCNYPRKPTYTKVSAIYQKDRCRCTGRAAQSVHTPCR